MAQEPRLTLLGKLVVAIVVVASGYGAWYYMRGSSASRPTSPADAGASAASDPTGLTTIGVAYGTEKQRWFEWAVTEFSQSRGGRGIRVQLIPMGSLESAQAILGGDQRITVWSPASSLYKASFVADWTLKHSKTPILHEEALALTPMVFVFWDERYQAFAKKFAAASFRTIAEALEEKSGWDGIAGRPEWGLFKFGHTHPTHSNSGLMTLVLMAFDYQQKCRGLTMKDILDEGFQDWMRQFERGVTGLSNSTGTMMRDMVLRGPSSFDALFVYESVAVDYLRNAEGRWGQLRILYPRLNMWNENPYYVLDAPWSSDAQKQAAGAFLDFLMSERVQKQSLTHGFRPGNPSVSIKSPDSPFVQYSGSGLRVDLTTSCEPPDAAVISNLLVGWQRSTGR
jgi:ABC-type glycerol-3-phosphate transport system substrate-binding protein